MDPCTPGIIVFLLIAIAMLLMRIQSQLDEIIKK